METIRHSQHAAHKILVIDDTYESRCLLANILAKERYVVTTESDGQCAFSRACAESPDLILLDIMMPELDGFEVCGQLKADPRTRDTPIIFISALDETFDKVHAFACGGVDYITKPLHSEDVLARVHTHLTIRRQQQQLADQNAILQTLITEKQEIFEIVSHDLRNPLQGIIGYNDLLQINPEKLTTYTGEIYKACQRMLHLITNLEHSNLLESGCMPLTYETFDMRLPLAHILPQFRQKTEARQIGLHADTPDSPVLVHADHHALLEILDNLISNAIKYSPDNTSIHVIISEQPHTVRCTVQDEGQGFTADEARKMFKKFSRLSAIPQGGERSTGLGLSIVKTLTEAMHGRVWAESAGKDQGSTFSVEFPKSRD